ncbi:ribosomal protein L7/L12 [Streptomyces formicae]|uniref:Ribosomal protein L7/L12 n=1 Tax=Streptomyces formicae TaxID=1616117 RepID=A0ABY3WIR6_9ACTN|nr:ribosomal protein L7/L12 [Streptomyces formicae]UNM12481.1 ribosomal protein L7/L12 [Streptomyces formicae]
MYIAALILVVGLALLSGSVDRKLSRVDRRIARLERKIDRVLDHLGIQETDPRLERVAALVRDGRKIEAIKVYREITDAGLKEAKDAVERIEAGG